MTLIVTRKPGGVTQLFNTETGRVTYKCKAVTVCSFFSAIFRIDSKDLKLLAGDFVAGITAGIPKLFR